MSSVVPPAYRDAVLALRLELIASSFLRQARRPLVQKSSDGVAAIWAAPCAILARYHQPEPGHYFANRCALEVYESDHLHFSAQFHSQNSSPDQALGPDRLFAAANTAGGFAKYSGNLLSCRGNRFRVQQALTWPLIDEEGDCHGHAAMFDLWIALD